MSIADDAEAAADKAKAIVADPQAAADGYGHATLDALKATSAEEVLKDMSHPAQVIQTTMARVSTQVLGVDLSKVTVDLVQHSMANVAIDIVREIMMAMLREVAKETGKDGASIIPVIGGLVNVWIDLYTGPHASGNGAASTMMAERSDFCHRLYAPTIGSGPNLSVVPADFWAGESRDGNGDPATPSIGQALTWITETTLPTYRTVGNNLRVPDQSVQRGVPLARQKVFRQLRTAITLSYKRADGGAALWPLYLDLLRHEFEVGHLTEALAAELIDAQSWPIHVEVRTPGENTCFAHEQRAYSTILQLVQGWKQAVKPFYTTFPPVVPDDLTPFVDKALAAAKAAAVKGSAVATLAEKDSAEPDASGASPSRTRWIVAGGVGLAGLGLAILGLVKMQGEKVRTEAIQ